MELSKPSIRGGPDRVDRRERTPQIRLSRKDTEPARLARSTSGSLGSTGSTVERSSLGRRCLCSILILRISGPPDVGIGRSDAGINQNGIPSWSVRFDAGARSEVAAGGRVE